MSAPPTSDRDAPRRALVRCVFRRDGEYWTIVYQDQTIRLKDAKGLHCLAHLLRNPGREFHASDLVPVDGSDVDAERSPASEPSSASLGGAGEPLDARAKAEYRRRLEDLREELAEAERFNDPGRAARARDEIEAISGELAAGVGLGGRDRPAASHAERARVMVTQRVKSVVAKIRESHPALARHLAATVKTGYFCSYNPDPAERISWEDSPERSEDAEPSERDTHRDAERLEILGMPGEPASRKNVWKAAAAILLLLLVAYGAPRFITPVSRPLLPLPDKPSIAILPFANLTGDPEQDVFIRGLTEDLITDASKLSGLFVIARDSVLPYAGQEVNVRDVGRDLGVGFVLEGSVRYVLEGSVRKAGDQVRINTRLWDATSGRQVWAERYDRQMKDTFAVQDDILRHVVADLQVNVRGAEVERVRRIPTENLTAYEAYVRGLDLAEGCSVASVSEAREMFERATALDSSFASAYAELGLLAVGEVFGPVAVHKLCPSRRDWWPVLFPVVGRLRELAERASALDDSLPAAHLLTAFLEPGTPRAVAEADRAVALGPSDARAHALSAAIYSTLPKPQEATTLLEKAMRLNPRAPDWYRFHLARAYMLAERNEDAASALEKLALSQPDFLWARMELAALYRKMGRAEKARIEEGEILRIYPAFLAETVPALVSVDEEVDDCEGGECGYGPAETVPPVAAHPPRAARGPTDPFFRLR